MKDMEEGDRTVAVLIRCIVMVMDITPILATLDQISSSFKDGISRVEQKRAQN